MFSASEIQLFNNDEFIGICIKAMIEENEFLRVSHVEDVDVDMSPDNPRKQWFKRLPATGRRVQLF